MNSFKFRNNFFDRLFNLGFNQYILFNWSFAKILRSPQILLLQKKEKKTKEEKTLNRFSSTSIRQELGPIWFDSNYETFFIISTDAAEKMAVQPFDKSNKAWFGFELLSQPRQEVLSSWHLVEALEWDAIGIMQELYLSTGKTIWATVQIGAYVWDQWSRRICGSRSWRHNNRGWP